MRAAFQQILRTSGQIRIGSKGLWPNYQQGIGNLDLVFGRENVTLRVFDPAALAGGDVVSDFCELAGIPLVPGQIQRVNESLSLEARALLYLQRSRGDGMVAGFPGAPARNERFIAALSRFGNTRLQLAPTLLEPILEEKRADLEWMEERLGLPLVDEVPEGGVQVESEAHLAEIGHRAAAEFEAFLFDEIRAGGATPEDRLIANIDALRKLNY